MGHSASWPRAFTNPSNVFALPPDCVGDIVVISDRHTVLGKAPEEHDLRLLEGWLRSHRDPIEQQVPLVLNRPLHAGYRQHRAPNSCNFDVFDVALNGVESANSRPNALCTSDHRVGAARGVQPRADAPIGGCNGCFTPHIEEEANGPRSGNLGYK